MCAKDGLCAIAIICDENLDRENSPEPRPHRRSDPQKRLHIDTSVELLALPGPYSELQFEGITAGDKLSVCYFIESDSMFARRREEMIPWLRVGISIKTLMIRVFSQRDTELLWMPSPKGRNTTKNISFRTYSPA
jgi:hypothetical protein